MASLKPLAGAKKYSGIPKRKPKIKIQETPQKFHRKLTKKGRKSFWISQGNSQEKTTENPGLYAMNLCHTYAFNMIIGIHCRRGDMEAALASLERMKPGEDNNLCFSAVFFFQIFGFTFLGLLGMICFYSFSRFLFGKSKFSQCFALLWHFSSFSLGFLIVTSKKGVKKINKDSW